MTVRFFHRSLLGMLALGLLVFAASGNLTAHEEDDAPGPGDPTAVTSEGEAHGGHHEELGHGDAGAGMEDPSELKADLAIWTFIVFLLVLAVLWKFAWNPIMEGLARREQAIADNIEQARRAAEDAQKQMAQYEARLQGASEEVREILEEARRDADTTRQRIIAEAKQAALSERDRALRDIELAKGEALQAVSQRGVDIALGLAGQIVRRELKPDDHTRLISEALEQLPSEN